MNDQGNKFDQEKPRMNLLDPEWLEETAQVLTFGARKYGAHNWKHVEPERYIAASMRHLMAIMKGEVHDPETGLTHAAHLSCNAMFLHHFIAERINIHENTDIQRHDAESVDEHSEPERPCSRGMLANDVEIDEGYHKLARSLNEVLDICGTYECDRTRVFYDTDKECLTVVLGTADETSDRIFHIGVATLRRLQGHACRCTSKT